MVSGISKKVTPGEKNNERATSCMNFSCFSGFTSVRSTSDFVNAHTDASPKCAMIHNATVV
jgi:hypothetical protein